MTRKSLAEFELLVMLAISRLGEDAYGGTIRKEIEVRTGRGVSVGALYATLGRLSDKGFLEQREDPHGRTGRGRPRKYCTLTSAGEEATRMSAQMLVRMMDHLHLTPGELT